MIYLKNKFKILYSDFVSIENKKLLGDTFILFFSKVFTAVIGLLTTILITRYAASPEVAGQYFFLLSVTMVLATVSRAGFDNVITRFIAIANNSVQPKEIKGVFDFISRRVSKSTLCFCGLYLIFFIVLSYYSIIILEKFYLLIIACILTIFVNASFVVNQCFLGLKFIVTYAALNSLPRLVMFLLLSFSVIFFNKISIVELLILYGINVILCLLVTLFIWYLIFNKIKGNDKKNVPTRTINKSANSLWLVSVLAIFMGYGAEICLGFLASDSQVSLFSVANRVALLVSFILLAVNNVLSPKFAEISGDNVTVEVRNELQNVYRKSTQTIFILTLPVLLFVYFFSSNILSIFGSYYLAADNVLKIIVLAQLFKVIVGSVGQLLIMTGNEKYQKLCISVSTALLFILLFILIPNFGALGAAISILFAVMCNNLLGLFFVYSKLNITLFNVGRK